MKKKGRRVLSVEVASSDHSDFEVTELYLRLVKDDFAEYLKEKKRYRGRPLFVQDGTAEEASADFEVLLPPYKLEISDTVVFGLKRILFFDKITMDGIEL